MAVGAAERGLQGQMQAIEPYRQRRFNAAYNFWLDVVEGDLQADDDIGNHAASLRLSRSAAQRQGSNAGRSAIL